MLAWPWTVALASWDEAPASGAKRAAASPSPGSERARVKKSGHRSQGRAHAHDPSDELGEGDEFGAPDWTTLLPASPPLVFASGPDTPPPAVRSMSAVPASSRLNPLRC